MWYAKNGAIDPALFFVNYNTMEKVAQQAMHLSMGALPSWQN